MIHFWRVVQKVRPILKIHIFIFIQASDIVPLEINDSLSEGK